MMNDKATITIKLRIRLNKSAVNPNTKLSALPLIIANNTSITATTNIKKYKTAIDLIR